ncbi:Hypothetical protein MSYG_1591 [Malassezia sympodialis ATCC 42132]|uniref:CCHC-type domain-containing protein n=1 Tax=Malassezia sympodialis (strain ATCC 42132) TaxID=1230383 RepID=A0A1M8A460_MALS4|nr:Hypothetical protein MSYG_1591 [Malassezia sympodialis ATCC 42132]
MYPSRVSVGRDESGRASRVCQRCERPGHAIYECKNPRPYKRRPTRTQVLNNPALEKQWRPTHSSEQVIQQPGAADRILQEREREREREQMRESMRPSHGNSLKRSASMASDESEFSASRSCSTCEESTATRSQLSYSDDDGKGSDSD